MIYEHEQIRERISHFIHSEGLTQVEFSSKIGRKQPNVSDIMRGKVSVTKGFLADILNAFPKLRKQWLIDGIGVMCEGDEERTVLPLTTKPRLPRDLSKGHLLDYFEGAKRPLCEEIPIDSRLPEYDFSLFLKTDRMSPNYRRGDELFFKKTAIKEWGGCYLLDTAEGPKFKKIYEDKDENGNPVIRCVAYDRVQYPDFIIPRDMVYGFYKCVGVLRIL